MAIKYIDTSISEKRILLRVDFNVTLNPNHSIADDFRIRQTIPTIEYLLKGNNQLIIASHMGQPEGRDEKYSLKPVAKDLQRYLPSYNIVLINDFMEEQELPRKEKTIYLLENLRFYEGEKKNDPVFTQALARLADIYVNDAFGVSHRNDASIVGIPKLLPSYGGLLLKKEITMIEKAIKNPKHPVVAIIGGAKVSTKIDLLARLMEIADYLLIGGGLANTFFAAEGHHIGSSFYEKDEKKHAAKLLDLAQKKKTELVLPIDVVVGDKNNPEGGDEVVRVDSMKQGEKRAIFDIGPETQARFGHLIEQAKTIIWNGPVGYIEHRVFRRGTDFLYYAITQNSNAVSIVGGGETLAAISKKEYLDKITHISTGGGSMLEFIEKGTLPGIEALTNKQ